jgi:hypothetical protein
VVDLLGVGVFGDAEYGEGLDRHVYIFLVY